jgi:hypothetical protein
MLEMSPKDQLSIIMCPGPGGCAKNTWKLLHVHNTSSSPTILGSMMKNLFRAAKLPGN